MKSSRRSLIVILLLTLALYAISLNGPFIYDDIDQIVKNAGLHRFPNLKAVVFCGMRQIRLLTNLSFSFSWWLSKGMTWSFHATSLGLHLLNIVLAWEYIGKMMPERRVSRLIAVFLFAVHPLQSEAISYIMAQSMLLNAFFYLLALVLFEQARGKFSIRLFCCLSISILAKESCALIPLLLMAHEWLIEGKPLRRLSFRQHAIYVGAVLLLIPANQWLKDTSYEGSIGFSLFPFWDYIGVQFHYYIYHLFLLLAPSYQRIYHEYPELIGWRWLTAILGGSYYLMATGFVIAGRLNPRWSRARFFVFFYLLSLIATNSPFQMINPFAEYRLYLANLSVFMLAGMAFESISGRLHMRHRKIAAVTGAVLAVILCGFNFEERMIWRDNIALFTAGLENEPNSYHIQEMLGAAYQEHGQIKEAEIYYKLAAQNAMKARYLPSLKPLFLLAQLYLQMGRPRDAITILDQLPLGNLVRAKPPVEYYKVILSALKQVGESERFEKTLAEGKRVYPDANLVAP